MEKQYYVYILKCSDGSLYCGVTNDRKRRLAAHNGGTGAKYTRSRRPVAMVWSEEAGSKSDALKREIEIKKMTRSQKIALISQKTDNSEQ